MKYVFSIFDRKSKIYSHHFICSNSEDARRAMTTSLYFLLVHNEESPFLTFPTDYFLTCTASISESPDDNLPSPSAFVDDNLELSDLLVEAQKLYKNYLQMQD